MASPTPAAPFQQWVVHLYDPRFGFFWFLETTMTVVTQTTVEYGTIVALDAYLDLMDAIVERMGSRFAAGEALTIVHDWRSMHGYDPQARARLQDRIRSRPKGYVRSNLTVVGLPTAWRMANTVVEMVFAFLQVPTPFISADIELAFKTLPRRQTMRRPPWLRIAEPGA